MIRNTLLQSFIVSHTLYNGQIPLQAPLKENMELHFQQGNGDLEKSPFCMEWGRIFSGTKHFIAEIAHREPKLQVAQIGYRLM